MERIYKRYIPAGQGRRPARYRHAACRAEQYPIPSGLYRLAGSHPRLACRRQPDLCRSGRGGAFVRRRLSGRSAVERRRDREGLVREDQIAALVPHAADRDAGRPAAVAELRQSRLLTPAALKAALADAARAQGFDVVGVARPDAIPRPRSGCGPSWPPAPMATWRGWRRTPTGAAIRARCGPTCVRSSCSASITARDDDPLAILKTRTRGAHFGLCAGRRLSRGDQAAAEEARPLADRASRRRHQGVRRYRRGDGEAARRSGRSRLAGQAHQSGLARNSAPGCSSARSSPRSICRPMRRSATIAAPAAPASTSARRPLSRRRIGSMRGAASPTSPSSTKARSRANCAPLMGNRIYGCDDCLAVCPWNKFAQAGREAKLAAREALRAPPLAELARLDDAASARCSRRARSSASAARALCAMC